MKKGRTAGLKDCQFRSISICLSFHPSISICIPAWPAEPVPFETISHRVPVHMTITISYPSRLDFRILRKKNFRIIVVLILHYTYFLVITFFYKCKLYAVRKSCREVRTNVGVLLPPSSGSLFRLYSQNVMRFLLVIARCHLCFFFPVGRRSKKSPKDEGGEGYILPYKPGLLFN